MDEELTEALELTRDDLVAKLRGGRKAKLARTPPARVGASESVETLSAVPDSDHDR